MDHTKQKIEIDLKQALDEAVEKEEQEIDLVAEAEEKWPKDLIDSLKFMSKEEGIPYEELIRMYNLALKKQDEKTILGKEVTPEQEDQIQKEYDEYVRAELKKMPRKHRRIYLRNQKKSDAIKKQLKPIRKNISK